MIYASGFTLEKIAAMQEHGIRGAHKPNIFTRAWAHLEASIFQGDMGKNLLNCSPSSDQLRRMVLIWPSVSLHPPLFSLQTDLLLVSVYWAYFVLRVYGVYAHSKGPMVCFEPSNALQVNGP